MEDTVKKLIEVVEKLSTMDQKLDNALDSQKEMKEDISKIAVSCEKFSARLTVAEEQIKELDKGNSILGKAIVGVLIAIVLAFIGHLYGGKL